MNIPVENKDYPLVFDDISIESPRIVHQSLYPHQRAAIYAIVEAEREYPAFRTNTLIYADKLGSGKTRVICTVIAYAPTPATFMPDLINDWVKIAVDARYLAQNLILVSTDTYTQWQSELALYPQLTVTYIGTQKELAAYLEDWRSGRSDVVLLRYSKSTRLCETLSSTVNWPYARVIVDDFDHIGYTIIPLGISYIGVSSTNAPKYKQTISMPRASDRRRTTLLRSSLVVRCSEEFIHRSTTLPKYFYYTVEVESAHRLALCFKNVAGMGELVEILASDAHDKIAEILHATIRTPADLYRILLGKVYSRQEIAEASGGRLAALTAEVVRLAKSGVAIRQMTSADALEIRKHVLEGAEITPAPLKGFGELSKELLEEVNEMRRQAGADVASVREAISANICELCRGPVGGDLNAIIVKCCNKIACMNCTTITWHRWGKTICPFNATHHLKPDDMVHISGKVSLEEIAASAPTSTQSLLPEPSAKPAAKPKTQSKIDVLLSIIDGRQEGTLAETVWPTLLNGDEYTYENTPRKVLVFTREDESIDRINKAMREAGIPTFILRGNVFSIRKTLRTCREHQGRLVLLINSTAHIHGFNAQFSTDLVFYHKIRDESVAAQVAGRIQRLGRTASARIWQVQYIGE